MIAKAFEFSGRKHLELNLTLVEAERLTVLLKQTVPHTMKDKAVRTEIMNAIERGWKVKPT